MRTVVVVTGASGSVFAVDLLKRLPGEKVLILTKWGKVVLREETGMAVSEMEALATQVFSDDDLAAPVSSGSNPFDAAVVMPCSASFLAKVSNGLGDTLGTRVCHIALKERRRLVLGLRESPLTGIALDNAARVSREGAIVMPVSPFFYLKPQSVEALVADFNDRVIQAATGASLEGGWRREDLR